MQLNKRYKFVILGAVSLCVGFIVYLIFRPDTYISKIIDLFFNVSFRGLDISNYMFIRFYVGDYLWAMSLSACLHAIFLPHSTGSIICTVATCSVGFVYELLQFFDIVVGTGDIIDFLMYLLAGLTVNILNKIIQRRKKK